MTTPASATPPSRATTWSAGARIGFGVVVAVLALVVVGLVAGSPDAERDLVDPNHLGPRLVLLSIILTAIAGLVVFAFSSRSPLVRALGLIGALVLSGAIVALLEMPEPPEGDPGELADVIVWVAQPDELAFVPQSPALFLVGPDGVTVATPGGLTPDEIETFADAAANLQGQEGLTPATANAPVDTGSREQLLMSVLPLEEASRLELDLTRADIAPVIVGPRERANGDQLVDVNVVTTDRPDQLPEPTDDAIDDMVGDLEDADYTVRRIDVLPDDRPVELFNEPTSASPDWTDALITLGTFLLAVTTALAIIGVVVAGFWWLGTRRFGWTRPSRQALPLADPTVPRSPDAIRWELADELDRALDELPLEGDPRHVVLAAYVRMTAVLADHGIARRPSDTPLEYLARALGEFDAGAEPIERLTRLMEVAMFSTHTVDAGMAGEAVDAFRAVRDGLRVVEPA